MRAWNDYSGLVWGFGNHEPVDMYRRGGVKTTGGVPGNALWMESWHHYFDSERSAALLAELGINIIHCRFYKGMGWQHESKDFPAVKAFAENCRKHGIKVLAYVQYSSLYWEIMSREIPNLRDWTIMDVHGDPRDYCGQYWRWLPCATSPEFTDYLCTILQKAMDAGCFDGVMFDNVLTYPCHCPRCQKAFKEFLKRTDKFNFLSCNDVTIPAKDVEWSTELHDPLQQAEVEFRAQAMIQNFAKFREYIKSRRPDFIISGNFTLVGQQNTFNGVNEFELHKYMDIIVSQSANDVKLDSGCVVTQVPELKFARALGVQSVPLNDNCAATPDGSKEPLIARLCENIFGGGIPAERSAMRPLRGGEPDMPLIEDRKKILATMKRWSSEYADLLASPHYEPVGVIFSKESIHCSNEALRSLMKVQESMMRNHIPYRILTADASGMLNDDWQKCSVIIIPESKLMSDTLIVQLKSYKGRLIAAGTESGDYDENYCQRAENPFAGIETLPLAPHEVISVGYGTRVRFAQDDPWRFLFPEAPFVSLIPECVVDYKCDADGRINGVLLSSVKPCPGGIIELPAGEWTAEPFGEAKRTMKIVDNHGVIPAFSGACILQRIK